MKRTFITPICTEKVFELLVLRVLFRDNFHLGLGTFTKDFENESPGREFIFLKNLNILASLKFIVTLALITIIGTANAQNYTPNTFTDPVITTVNNTTGTINGGGTITLRSALLAADNLGGTHTITLSTGTYNLDGSATYTISGPSTFSARTIYLGNRAQNITINGNGPGNTIINMATAGRDRIMTINYNGDSPDVITTINGVKFTNGYLTSDEYGGAAIYAGPVGGNLQTLNISNCAFDNNICPTSAGNGGVGGAIYMFQETINIDNSTFTNNKSIDGVGGAIFYTLYNNEGNKGNVSITNSTFSGNTAKENGGAIHITSQGAQPGGTTFVTNINNNTFLNNSTTLGDGGAIALNNGANLSIMQLHYNRFVGNISAASPTTSGMLFVNSAGSVNADNNWWGCNTGPTAAGTCDKAAGIGASGGGSLIMTKWLQLKTTASPGTICNTATGLGNTATITTSFLTNSANEAISTANLSTLIGRTVNWGPTTLGALSGQQGSIQASGTATALFTSNGTGGTATINAQVDNVPTGETTPSRANITVNTLPIVTNPTNVVSCVGGTATFTSTITGTPAPTITWRIGGTALVNGVQGSGATVSGQGTNTLTITNVQPGDAATNYNVQAVNQCGTSTSANATLTPNNNNTVTFTSAAGTDVQSVPVNTPITPITYGTTGATGATVTGLPASVTGSWAGDVVTINGTPTTAAGSPFSYTVILTGGCGTVTATGTLTVTTPPTITTGTVTGTISACVGTASTNTQSFTYSGSNLTDFLVATAPTGFEVSTAPSSGFGSSATLNPSAGQAASGTIYVRSSASAAAGGISGNVILATAGTTDKNVAVSGTVNSTPAPTSPTATPSTVTVSGNTTTLTATGCDAPSTISWYDSSNPSVALPNNTPAITASKTFFAKCTGANTCVSDASVTVSVTYNPCVPVSTPTGTLTWTGLNSTDWNTACNWSPASVPAVGNDVVIPNVTNKPIIGAATAAVAKSVEVQSGATLTISSSGALAVNGSRNISGINTAFYNTGTVGNSGQLSIGNVSSAGDNSITNTGTFSNSACATLTVFDNINNSSSFTNAGLFRVNTSQAHTNSALTNNGIIEYTQGNPIPNVTNNDLVVAPISICGTPVSQALQIGGANSFTAGSIWYSDASLTAPAGTYSQGTNTFTLTDLALQGTQTLYLSVSDVSNPCPQTVSINVTITPSPVGPTLNVKTPAVAAVCFGTAVSATFTTGSGGVGCSDDYIVSIDGAAAVAYTPGSNVGAAASSSIVIQGRRANCGAGSGCTGTAYVTLASWTVSPQPVGPTLLAKTPNVAAVCFGTAVSATFNAGSGGVGCSDDYTVSIDGAAAVAYTPGGNVGAAASSSIVIQGRRANCGAGSGCNGTAYVTLASWTVSPQPVGPTLLAKTPNVAAVCFGTAVSATFTAGSGGVGCSDDYIVSIDGAAAVAYTPGGSVGAAASSSIVIQGRRANCGAGSGCNGTAYVTLASWTVSPQPVGPTLSVKTPSVTAVCFGTAVSATFNAGSGGVGCSDDYTVSIDGAAAVAYTPGGNVGAAASSSIIIQGRRANCGAGSGCSGTAYVTLASWTVSPQPVGPTLSVKTPNVAAVCFGTAVSATFNAGSGGVSCSDDYTVSIDGAAAVAYTPGSNVGAAASSSIVIQGRRANCGAGSGCNGTAYVTLASWTVSPQPVGPTLLAKTPSVAAVCFGTAVSATFTAGSGGCADDYTVSIDGAAAVAYTPGGNVGAAASSSIIIQGRRANCGAGSGCSGTAYVTLASWTVSPISVGGTIAGSAAVCAGSNSTPLTLSGQVGAIQKWQSSLTANFASPTDIANTTASLTAANLSQTTYYRAVVQSGSCAPAFSTTAMVTVNAPPTLSTSGNTSVVYGYGSNCTTLTATASSGPASLSWSTGATGGSIQVCPTATTIYTVTATGSNLCSASQSLTVTVNDVRCGAGGVQMCYQGRQVCVAPYLVPTYQRYGATLGGCGGGGSRLSAEAMTPLAGSQQLTLSAYPNPVVDAVTVEVLAPKAGGATLDVVDVTGRTRQTHRRELSEGQNEVELRLGSLPTGIYLIRLRDAAGRQATVRVSKE